MKLYRIVVWRGVICTYNLFCLFADGKEKVQLPTSQETGLLLEKY